MAQVIPFRRNRMPAEEEIEIDLLTAVDVAIRDLREISLRCEQESARKQADECCRMLERAFNAALAEY
jgi:hypothetical protein